MSQQKCRAEILVFGNIMFIRIFTVVPWRVVSIDTGLVDKWRLFSVLSVGVVISSEPFKVVR